MGSAVVIEFGIIDIDFEVGCIVVYEVGCEVDCWYLSFHHNESTFHM